jgi:hypothetical protein
MLIALICIFMAVWSCAYLAARVYRGWPAFIALYLVAVIAAPAVFAGGFHLIYRGVDAQNAAAFTRLVALLGVAVGVVFFPLSYLRLRREGGG